MFAGSPALSGSQTTSRCQRTSGVLEGLRWFGSSGWMQVIGLAKPTESSCVPYVVVHLTTCLT